MTIPRGSAVYHLYAAAANQEARIESRDMRHHCKQQWRTVDQIRLFQHFPLVPGCRGE